MKKKIFLITLLSMVVLTGCAKEIKEEESKIVENNNGMLSYTIDGEKTDIKPSKEDGYIVNKIICDNGSDMMWDNDNWEIELTNIVSKDRCKVDFTKDTSKDGYRITVTSNMTSVLDSLSKATTLNGTVKIYSKATIKNVTGCNGIIEDSKVIVSNVISNQTCNMEVEDKTLAGTIKSVYTPQPERTTFNTINQGDPGLYTSSDDDGLTYYFSGDGTSMNNWVSFAGVLWRIIRINGNGSIRLLYEGDGMLGTEENNYNGVGSNIGRNTFSNAANNHPSYIGWKYAVGGSLLGDRGNSKKSLAYLAVETWYKDNIKLTYENYIDTGAIYCNDRNLTDGNKYSISSSFGYAAYGRLVIKKGIPIFTCSNEADKFPHKNSNGELIDIPVGLMTADEVVAAGGLIYTSNSKAYYYLAKDGNNSVTGDKWWWTMTPCNWDHNYNYVNGMGVYGSSFPGFLSNSQVSNILVIRPVISLKKEVQVISGDGSAESPYEVTI